MNTGDTRTAKCQHCGRVRHFRTAEAAAKAYPAGRICRMKIRLAAMGEILRGFTQAQIEAAREMLADGGLVALGHHDAYRVASSDGSAVYTTSPKGCNCPNWLRRLMPKQCKHQLLVRIDLAAKGI